MKVTVVTTRTQRWEMRFSTVEKYRHFGDQNFRLERDYFEGVTVSIPHSLPP